MKDKIERQRKILHEKMQSREGSDEEVIKASRELDQCILEYYRSNGNRD